MENTAQPTNKVFELIDFLHSKKDAIIEGHYRVAYDYYKKKNLYHSLRPKHALADDTAYKEAFKDAENAQINYDNVLKTYKEKFYELDFEDRSFYKGVLSSMFDVWEKNMTKKSEAINQLRECKDKFNDLQDEKVIYFLDRAYSPFFGDLCDVLSEKFDFYLEPKYSGLSEALQPYLEGASDAVMESIIDERKLPQGADKPIWKHQTDAHRFRSVFNWELKDLNRVFRYRNDKGKIIDKTYSGRKSRKIEADNELKLILEKYK